MKIKIISDSASDLRKDYVNNANVELCIAPLVVNIGDREYVDDEITNPAEMLADFDSYDGKTSSACPSPQSYYEAIGNSEYSFIITISGSLSGSYNSACVAKQMAEKEGKKVFVLDSKATCGVQILMVDKLVELIEKEKNIDEVYKQIQQYRDDRKLLFVLKKFDNLIQNGRMSKFTAMVASVLNITPICAKTPQGTIDVKEKLIGPKKVLRRLKELITEQITDFSKDEIIISHCFADAESKQLAESIMAEHPECKAIRIIKTKVLASYYALQHGMIISF